MINFFVTHRDGTKKMPLTAMTVVIEIVAIVGAGLLYHISGEHRLVF